MEEEDVMQNALGEVIEGNYNTAIYQLTKVLADKKDNCNAVLLRARAYFEKGEYENAINDYGEAEKAAKEENADLCYMKAEALFYNQNFEGSKRELEKALGINGVTEEQKTKINCLINKMKFD